MDQRVVERADNLDNRYLNIAAGGPPPSLALSGGGVSEHCNQRHREIAGE
jgi:hypothetical protein